MNVFYACDQVVFKMNYEIFWQRMFRERERAGESGSESYVCIARKILSPAAINHGRVGKRTWPKLSAHREINK